MTGVAAVDSVVPGTGAISKFELMGETPAPSVAGAPPD